MKIWRGASGGQAPGAREDVEAGGLIHPDSHFAVTWQGLSTSLGVNVVGVDVLGADMAGFCQRR